MEIVKIGSNGSHDGEFKVSRPNGYPYYLFLLVKTPAVFLLEGREVSADSGSVIIYDINYPHYYSATGSCYINDWIHIRMDQGKEYFQSLNIPLNTIIKVFDDTFVCEMIRLMSNEYYSVNPKKNETMPLLLQTMFVKLSEVIADSKHKEPINVHYSSLVNLRKEIYSNPQQEWSVSRMASKMNMCNTYLQKIYRRTFGISCVADVIECKLGYAKELLSKTMLPVGKIAGECGYKNEVHFMRQFKRCVGVTPTEYRKRFF